jgi:hypothetical protein
VAAIAVAGIALVTWTASGDWILVGVCRLHGGYCHGNTVVVDRTPAARVCRG